MERRDLRVASALLSPEHMIPLAREYGDGDPVIGARSAWLEVRGIIRDWIRFVKRRDESESSLKLAFSFKALGVVGNYCHVLEVKKEPWRRIAIQCWDGPTPIYGKTIVNVGDSSQEQVNCSALRGIAKALKLVPTINRAVLDNRVWQRSSGEIMLNFELAGKMYSTVFNSFEKPDIWLGRRIRNAIKTARKMSKNELSWLGEELTLKWVKSGFIASPAGVMVSLMGNTGIDDGYATLVGSNGIPTAIAVCAINKETKKVVVSGAFDHRVIDGRTETRFLKIIKEEMECELS